MQNFANFFARFMQKFFVYLLQNDLHIFSNNLLSPELTITFAARNFHKFCQILFQKSRKEI